MIEIPSGSSKSLLLERVPGLNEYRLQVSASKRCVWCWIVTFEAATLIHLEQQPAGPTRGLSAKYTMMAFTGGAQGATRQADLKRATLSRTWSGGWRLAMSARSWDIFLSCVDALPSSRGQYSVKVWRIEFWLLVPRSARKMTFSSASLCCARIVAMCVAASLF